MTTPVLASRLLVVLFSFCVLIGGSASTKSFSASTACRSTPALMYPLQVFHPFLSSSRTVSQGGCANTCQSNRQGRDPTLKKCQKCGGRGKPRETVDDCIVTRRVGFDDEVYQDDEGFFSMHWRRNDNIGDKWKGCMSR